MAKLSEEVKDFIIIELAAYTSLRQVAELVKEKYGLTVTRQQVYEYDPTTTRGGKSISKKRRAMFEKARKKFRETTDDIPIAHKAIRLRKLDRMVQKAEEMSNLDMAARLMKQAAEEEGGAYTNQRNVKHSGAVGTYDLDEGEIDAELRTFGVGRAAGAN